MSAESESDPREERVVLRILEALTRDAHAGELASLEHYRASFGDHEALLRQEYARFVRAEPGAETEEQARSWGDYELIELLGRGGQGSVYRARDRRLGREVALKLLLSESAVESSRAPAPLRRELEALTRLAHAGIAGLYEAGVHAGQAFLATRFVEGPSLAAELARWRERGAPALRARIALGAAIAEALGAAHAAGVVHRDLKPSNVVIDGRGAPVLIDFGLARAQESAWPTLTRTGDVLGTPRYLAPERFAGRGTQDARGDVWSLGVLLYELLALRPPFEGSSLEVLARAVETREPTRLRQVLHGRIEGVSVRDLEAVVEKALEKEPARRYADGGSVADELAHLLRGEAVQARRAASLERSARWMRRHPAPSAVIALLLVLALGGAFTAARLEQTASAERGARLELLASVARADADRARMLLDSVEPSSHLRARTHLRAVSEALRQLEEAGAEAAQLQRPAFASLRSDAIRAWCASDLQQVPAPDLGGLGVVRVDPRAHVGVGLTVDALGGRIQLRATALDAAQEPIQLAPAPASADLLAVAPQASHLVWRSADGALLQTREGALQALSLASGSAVQVADFDRRGRTLALSGAGEWRLLRVSDGSELARGSFPAESTPCLGFAPDGSRLAIPAADGALRLLDVDDPQRALAEWALPGVPLAVGAASPGLAHRLAAAVCRSADGVELVLLDDAASAARRVRLPVEQGSDTGAALALSDELAAIVAGDALLVVELQSGQLLHRSLRTGLGAVDVLRLMELPDGHELWFQRRTAPLERALLIAHQPLLRRAEPERLAPPAAPPLGSRLETGDPFQQLAAQRPFFLAQPEQELHLPGGARMSRGPLERTGDLAQASAARPARVAARVQGLVPGAMREWVVVWEQGRSEPLFSVPLEHSARESALALDPTGDWVHLLEADGRWSVWACADPEPWLVVSTPIRNPQRMQWAQGGDLLVLDREGRAWQVHLAALRTRLRELGFER